MDEKLEAIKAFVEMMEIVQGTPCKTGGYRELRLYEKGYEHAITNIITLSQYQALKTLVQKGNYPEIPDSSKGSNSTGLKDGWIKHDGNGQPVDDDVIVEVEFRGGGKDEARADYFSISFEWGHSTWAGDIIAYRIVEEPKISSTQAFENYLDNLERKKSAEIINALEGKKKYKLSEMWKVWVLSDYETYKKIFAISDYFPSIDDAKNVVRGMSYPTEKALAITRADATSFYEGEGLDDE